MRKKIEYLVKNNELTDDASDLYEDLLFNIDLYIEKLEKNKLKKADREKIIEYLALFYELKDKF